MNCFTINKITKFTSTICYNSFIKCSIKSLFRFICFNYSFSCRCLTAASTAIILPSPIEEQTVSTTCCCSKVSNTTSYKISRLGFTLAYYLFIYYMSILQYILLLHKEVLVVYIQ